jgi:hypothetical protein
MDNSAWSCPYQSKFSSLPLTPSLIPSPHNMNLFRWKKLKSSMFHLCRREPQTLLHVLNNCPVALECRRYNQRHNSVLSSIHSFLADNLPQRIKIVSDLPGTTYTFPPTVALTDERPDLWCGMTTRFTS